MHAWTLEIETVNGFEKSLFVLNKTRERTNRNTGQKTHLSSSKLYISSYFISSVFLGGSGWTWTGAATGFGAGTGLGTGSGSSGSGSGSGEGSGEGSSGCFGSSSIGLGGSSVLDCCKQISRVTIMTPNIYIHPSVI